MSDDSAPLVSSSAVTVLLLLVVTAAVAMTAGLAIGTGALAPGSDADDSETAELTGLETFEPECGTHRSSNSSSHVRPAGSGVEISINETVPVAARDSELDADLEEVGENRYLLDLERTAGNRTTDCYLEMRYNVTVVLPDRNDYTLIRTVDRTYHGLLYGDRNSGGGSGSNLDPRPPSMNDSEWEAALNASDDYFYNESHDGSSGGSGGDESGGSASSGGSSASSLAS